MPKRKSSSAQDPECIAKEYKKLPPCTTSQQDQEQEHDHDHDHDTTTVQPGETHSKRKWRRKPNKRAKPQLNDNDHQLNEVLVSHEPHDVRLGKLQEDVDEVVEIVRANVDGILKREGKVEDLEIAADRLHDAALEFKKTGRVVLMKYWWRKNRCCVIILCLIILVIMIGLAAGLTKRFRTHDLDTPVSITNVTTEPLGNVSTSIMQMNVTRWPL